MSSSNRLESLLSCFETLCGQPGESSSNRSADVINVEKERGLVVSSSLDKDQVQGGRAKKCDDNASNHTDSTSEASVFASLSDSSSKEEDIQPDNRAYQHSETEEESTVGSTNATFLEVTNDTDSSKNKENDTNSPKHRTRSPQDNSDTRHEPEVAASEPAVETIGEPSKEIQLDEISAPPIDRSIILKDESDSEPNGHQARSLSSSYNTATSSINKISKSVRKATSEIKKTKRMFRTFTNSIKSLQNEVQALAG